MAEENKKALISEDLTTDANADQQTSSIRETSDLVLTKYNVDEKFITAKFANVEDLKKSYDSIVENGYPKEQIVLAIVGHKEDEFYKSVDALKKAYDDETAENKYVSMGLEVDSDEIRNYVCGVWDSNHASKIND